MEVEQNETNNLVMSNRGRMATLFYRQVPGTEMLYQGIGYSMRMKFWDHINDTGSITTIMMARQESDYKQIYEHMMKLMNSFINKNEADMDITNQIIFNRDLVKKNYESHPEMYVNKLRECLKKENELLKKYYYIQQDGLTPEELPSPPTQHNGVTDTNEEFVSSPSRSILYQDTGFLSEIESQCNTFSTCKSQLNGQDIRYQQAYYESIDRLMLSLQDGLERLKDIQSRFFEYQARMEVELMQKGDIESEITEIFKRYAKVLRWFHKECVNPPSNWDNIIAMYMNLALIVQRHPDGYTFIENVKREETKDSSQGKGKKMKEGTNKNPKVYSTKKNSGITTTLQILGSSDLHDLPGFELKSYSLKLVTEDEQTAGDLSYQNDCQLCDSQISFQDIKVNGHQRESSKNTRSQFLRLMFTVKMVCFGREFELKTKSLPFNLVTGSLQALEFTGTRLWYFFCNMKDMYSNCRMDNDFEKGRFLQMLDHVFQTISYKQKSPRKLSFNDKEFLWNQIPANKGKSSDPKMKITEQAFLKTPIGCTPGTDVKKEFSFYTWFYALVNTIKSFLLEPWLDGMIYGLLTKNGAEEVLSRDDILPGTALLRPVTSSVLNPNCKNAQVKIAIEIKVRMGDDDKIMVVDMSAEEFSKHGLHDKLKRISIQSSDDTAGPQRSTAAIKQILTAGNELVNMSDLKDRYLGASSNFEEGYHKCNVAKINQLVLDCSKNKTHSHSSAKSAKLWDDDSSDDTSTDFSPRRRRVASRQDSSPAYSPSSSNYNGWSNGMLGGRNTDAWSPGVASNSTAGTYSPRSQEQVDCYDESSANVNHGSPENKHIPPNASPAHDWSQFGEIQVDIAKVKRLSIPNGNGFSPSSDPFSFGDSCNMYLVQTNVNMPEFVMSPPTNTPLSNGILTNGHHTNYFNAPTTANGVEYSQPESMNTACEFSLADTVVQGQSTIQNGSTPELSEGLKSWIVSSVPASDNKEVNSILKDLQRVK